jgi:hypothetical protein
MISIEEKPDLYILITDRCDLDGSSVFTHVSEPLTRKEVMDKIGKYDVQDTYVSFRCFKIS